MATSDSVSDSRISGMHYSSTDDDQDDDDEEESDLDFNDNNVEAEDEPKEPDSVSGGGFRREFGVVLDPRAKWVQEWNRVFLLVSATGLFVDPLFFYALSISDTCMCLFIDGWLVVTVTVLRCMTDTLHVWNMWLQFKMAKRSSFLARDSYASRGGSALRYLRAKRGFFFDLFVILPIPQVTPFFSFFSSINSHIFIFVLQYSTLN